MVKRNENFTKLKSSYLFYEIAKRKEKFLEDNPGVNLINLGIGDTTRPIPNIVFEGLSEAGKKLGTIEGYSGYGPAAGIEELRIKISEVIYGGRVTPDEIFISDGSKCDIGRLQTLFGPKVKIAVQDPAYPVYVDGSLIQGVSEIITMPCRPENDFFPDLALAKKSDLIYFCSPNNPTGSVATKQQLEELIRHAINHKSIIIFDSAYSGFIQDSHLPRTIFEIPDARACAIETGSFSKLAGFTGVRLGWTVVSKELRYNDGSSVYQDWLRVISTIFNGPSNIAQAGGLSILSLKGLEEVRKLVQEYMLQAKKLLNTLKNNDLKVFGGVNCPYLWTKFPEKKSWDIFQTLLNENHIISTPGCGFGSAGEGFVRFSAFAHSKDIDRAIMSLSKGQVSCRL